ncbi:MAG TPA: CDGSH iron-sulfur domain-containing protein [Gammaproteobacteria bacterium]|nr:CDGSH iron-sulfur domain-containing protein [Gammaproteobacteria bacterium]
MSMYSRGEPYEVSLQRGDSVYICQCGFTKTPPMCDGSHNDHPGTEPLAYMAAQDETVYICGCGKTANKPWCDGSHNAS